MVPNYHFSAVAGVCRVSAVAGEDSNHTVDILLARNTVEIYQKN